MSDETRIAQLWSTAKTKLGHIKGSIEQCALIWPEVSFFERIMAVGHPSDTLDNFRKGCALSNAAALAAVMALVVQFKVRFGNELPAWLLFTAFLFIVGTISGWVSVSLKPVLHTIEKKGKEKCDEAIKAEEQALKRRAVRDHARLNELQEERETRSKLSLARREGIVSRCAQICFCTLISGSILFTAAIFFMPFPEAPGAPTSVTLPPPETAQLTPAPQR